MSAPRQGFDRLSRWYDVMLYVTSGRAIPKSQTALLTHVPEGKKALIIGGGTGSFLVELIKSRKAAAITYVDLSEGMIRESRRKVEAKVPEAMPDVQFICGTIEELKGDEPYDLIFTHYLLDLFEEKERLALMAKIRQQLSPKGYWYVSDFAYANQKLYKIAHWLLYRFFRALCGISGNQIPDLKSEFNAMGMKLVIEKYFLKRFLWAGIWRYSDDKANTLDV